MPTRHRLPEMRAFGLIGLVLALLIVGWLAKRQMGSLIAPPLPGSSAPAASVRDQSQQIQQQIKQSLDAATQPRAMPDE